MSMTIFLTGLPCSGKTTIAKRLVQTLLNHHHQVEFLDGDNIRGVFQDKDFSKDGRISHIKKIMFLCKTLNNHDVDVVASFVSPYKESREYGKSMIPNFYEIFVDCPLEECIKRDVKGMYKKALNGEIKGFTGIDDPYEPPEKPFLTLHTDKASVESCVFQILDKIKEVDSYSTYLIKGGEINKGPSFFIGRYQTFHAGHSTLMQKVLDEGKDIIIALRDTEIGGKNPYTIKERIDMIKNVFPEAVLYPEKGRIVICIIPDMSEVVFGRGVGWSIRNIKLPSEIESISATKLREKKNV